MYAVTLVLPVDHDLDQDDPDSCTIVQEGIEALLGPIVMTIRRRPCPRPLVVIDGEKDDREV